MVSLYARRRDRRLTYLGDEDTAVRMMHALTAGGWTVVIIQARYTGQAWGQA